MGKNKGKGGKKKRKGKNDGDDSKKELIFKKEGQAYGKVTKMFGNCRIGVVCEDSKERIAHIPGSMTRRVWISSGDIILLGVRDYQDGKCDVLHKYTPQEARNLKAYGELPDHFDIGESYINEDDDIKIGTGEPRDDPNDDSDDPNDDSDDDSGEPDRDGLQLSAAAKPAAAKPAAAKPAAKPAAAKQSTKTG